MEAIREVVSGPARERRRWRAPFWRAWAVALVAPFGWLCLAAAEAPPAHAALACQTDDATFSFTGAEQCYTVPGGVTSIRVVAIGGIGGNAPASSGAPALGGAGGGAAQVTADLRVTPGAVIYVEVGGAGGPGGICLVGSPACTGTTGTGAGGFNGGGQGGVTHAPSSEVADLFAGGGGGASDVRTVPMGSATCPGGASAGSTASLGSRLLVAGGGGGGGNIGAGQGENGGDGGSSSSASKGGSDGGSGAARDGKGGGAGGGAPGGGGGAGTGSTSGQAGADGGSGCGGGGGAGSSGNSGGGGGAGRFGGGGGGGGATVIGATPPSLAQGAGGGGGGGSAYVSSGAACRAASITTSTNAAQVTISATDPCGTSAGATPTPTPSSRVKGTPPQPPGTTGADPTAMMAGGFLAASGMLITWAARTSRRRRDQPSRMSQK